MEGGQVGDPPPSMNLVQEGSQGRTGDRNVKRSKTPCRGVDQIILTACSKRRVPANMSLWVAAQRSEGVKGDCQREEGIFITAGSLKGNNAVIFPNQLVKVDQKGRCMVLVTNFGHRAVTVRKGRHMCLGHGDHAILRETDFILGNQMTMAKEERRLAHHSKDIRLRPEYVEYIERELLICKEEYVEAFVNELDFTQRDWSVEEKIWLNPPWDLIAPMVMKLQRDQPKEWVVIMPVYANFSKAYQYLSALTVVQVLPLKQSQ